MWPGFYCQSSFAVSDEQMAANLGDACAQTFVNTFRFCPAADSDTQGGKSNNQHRAGKQTPGILLFCLSQVSVRRTTKRFLISPMDAQTQSDYMQLKRCLLLPLKWLTGDGSMFSLVFMTRRYSSPAFSLRLWLSISKLPLGPICRFKVFKEILHSVLLFLERNHCA